MYKYTHPRVHDYNMLRQVMQADVSAVIIKCQHYINSGMVLNNIQGPVSN